jgi:hypothetical protein
MTFEFGTTDYEFAHGRSPKGYGSWAFDWEGTCREPKPVWAPTSTYADAKRWVNEHISLRAGGTAPSTSRSAPDTEGDSPMTTCLAIDGYRVGHRVELHSSTDAWMSGDRYGEVVKLTPPPANRIHVRMDYSGRTLKLRSWQIAGQLVAEAD